MGKRGKQRDWTEEDRYRPMEGRCNAERQDGTFCKAFPMPNGKCHRHGGKNPSGIASTHFKHGRSSKHLPSRLLDRYKEFIGDEEMLSLTNEIALIDTRLSEMLDGMSLEDGAQMWSRLSRLHERYERQMSSRHTTRANETLEKIFDIIEAGANEFQKWSSVLDLIDRRRKTVESERKRHVEMQQMMSAKEAVTLLSAIHDSLKNNVDDPKVLRNVVRDIDRLFLSEGPRPPAQA